MCVFACVLVCDKKINDFEYELRDLCISTTLNILNGRTIGELSGKYTYIRPNGCSSGAYVLASDDIYNDRKIVTNPKVNDLTTISPHNSLLEDNTTK